MHRLLRYLVAVLISLVSACALVGAAPAASSDEWQQVDLLGQAVGRTFEAPQVAYGNGHFVAVAWARPNSIFVSEDGVSWTEVPIEGPYVATSVLFARGQFWVTAGSMYGTDLYTSADGESWKQARLPSVVWGSLTRLAYGNGQFVSVYEGRFGRTGLYASADGLQWASVADSRFWEEPVAYGNGTFVAVAAGPFMFGESSSQARILISGDGLSWEIITAPDQSNLIGVAYGRGRFVAVGDQGHIYTSEDGRTWTQRPSGTTSRLTHVAFVMGRFQAFSPDGSRLTSVDGVTWEADSSGIILAISHAQGNGKVVSTMPDGTLRVGSICTGQFADVGASAPACWEIELLAGRQIVSGFPDGRFRPDRTVTRAELAKMLTLALADRSLGTADLPFSDVAGHWATQGGYLQAARAMHALDGFPDGTFRPDAAITRGELTKIIVAAAGLQPGGKSSYTNLNGEEWYAGWVASAEDHGLIGTNAPTPIWDRDQFDGDQPATRAEAAIVLGNLLNFVRP